MEQKEDGEDGSWLSSKAIYLPRYKVSPNNYCQRASLNGIKPRPASIAFIYSRMPWENFVACCARNVMGFFGEISVARNSQRSIMKKTAKGFLLRAFLKTSPQQQLVMLEHDDESVSDLFGAA